MELQISVWNDSETSITWNYQTFRISGPENKYRLTVGGGTGDGSDPLANHNGQYFSTYDRDNDASAVIALTLLKEDGGIMIVIVLTKMVTIKYLAFLEFGKLDSCYHYMVMIKGSECTLTQ